MGLVGKLPTFVELFTGWRNYSFSSWAETTSAIRTFNRPAAMQDGQSWYLFYISGGSLELSRLDGDSNGTMQKTRIAHWTTEPDSAWYGSSLTDDRTAVQTNYAMHSATMIAMRFSLSPTVVENMFWYAYGGTFKYYRNNSTPTSSNSNLQVAKSTVTNWGGIGIATFKDTTTGKGCFSVSSNSSPTTAIVGARIGNTGTSFSAIRSFTSSGTEYLVPTADDATTASVYMYSYKFFYEDW